jgi:hypothetical protein
MRLMKKLTPTLETILSEETVATGKLKVQPDIPVPLQGGGGHTIDRRISY